MANRTISLVTIAIGLTIAVLSPAGAKENIADVRINEQRRITVSTDSSLSASEAGQLAQEVKLADKIVSEFLGIKYDGDYRV